MAAAVVLGVLAVGVLYAAESLLPTAVSISLRGTLTIGVVGFERGGLYEGDSCDGRKQYADIVTGSKTVIYDGTTNATLGVTALEPGHIDAFGNCVFRFSLTGVSKVDSYNIEVASRGLHRLPYRELAAKGYSVTLELGQLSSEKLPAKTLGGGVSSSKKYQLQDLTSDQNVKQ